MSDLEPPPAKRTRQSIRNSTNSKETVSNSASTFPSQTRYMLRSRTGHSQQNEYVALPEPKRKRKPRIVKLMDMNADCLLAIFKEMDPKTLAYVADTSEWFRNLAQYHFRLKYSRFDFDTFGNFEGTGTERLEDAEKFFRNFGGQIVSLKINCAYFIQFRNTSDELLRLINQHCYFLKTLELFEFTLTNNSAKIMEPIFNSIENLTLHVCTITDFNLCSMVNLKCLILNGNTCYLWSDTLWKHFPKLEEIQLKSLTFLSDDTIVQFVTLNPNLKRIIISDCYSTTTSIFKAIGKLEHLQEFKYAYGDHYTEQSFQSDLRHLVLLKNIKILKLDFYYSSPSSFIENLITSSVAIEHLVLINGIGNDSLFENIAKMNTLKALELFDIVGLKENHILYFAKNLKQLEMLTIKGEITLTRQGIKTIVREAKQLTCLKIELPEFTLTLPIYLEILDIMQKREESVVLNVTIFGYKEQMAVPDEVAKGKNEKWLCVKWLLMNFDLF